MKSLQHLSLGMCLCLCALGAMFPARTEAADSATAKKLFAHPPREYATAPLWVWNDQLTEEQVTGTMRDLAQQGVKQVFVHPRPGLMTPYLSPDWFRLWKAALKEAGHLDMNVWIYDENSYPSGFAGGFVPEEMPEARGRGLSFAESKTAPAWATNILGVYQMDGAKSENVTAKVKAGEALPEARYLVATEIRAPNKPWNAGRCYVDLLYPGVTKKFLDVTLGAYKRELGDQFGKRIPGSFTDEPNLIPAGGLPWTADLAEAFQKRWGYDLLDNLPSLHGQSGDWKRVRENYFQLLSELFVERWSKPYRDYCASNHLEFTGHYWEHDWPNCHAVPDNMAMYAWPQRPAIDQLMNIYSTDVHAQFGNARMVRELSSVANQVGAKRTLCETYGAGGWDLRFEDMKRIGDWVSVLGINTIDQHLSYITIRGARKRDHPQSFSYHEPWWKAYHVSAQYLARLSATLSQGEQINPVLLLEPTTTAWMYNCGQEPRLAELGNSFQALVHALEAAQVEYDIGCEEIMAQQGSVVGQELKVGHRRYGVVVLPPFTENLHRGTMALLEKYVAAGGAVLACGDPPRRVDGEHSDRPAALVKQSSWQKTSEKEVIGLLQAKASDRFKIYRAAGDAGILFHHRRQLEDGDLVFLVNSSITAGSSGMVESAWHGVEQWNLTTGKAEPYPFDAQPGGVTAKFKLPPSGSLLLFFSRASKKPVPAPIESTSVLKATAAPEIKRLEPNVLTLDFVDVTAGGETRTNLYCYQASQFAFQKNGMERNPWDSAVQFRDELISKTFPTNSGVEATYRFVIKEKVPEHLAIVIERADLYSVTCNGKPILPVKNAWWLDKAFSRISLAGTAQAGENTITIKAAPFTIYHELEPAYLIGHFKLEPVEKGFVVAPESKLPLGKWNELGQPFYSAGVSYREKFNVESKAGKFFVSLPGWYGSVAEVRVNGTAAKFIDAPPWQCEVTSAVRKGANQVEVIVYGTLKNTLGPHHGKPPLGAAWPPHFHVAPKDGLPPGCDYSTVGYGLFEPFVLNQVTAAPLAAGK